MDDSTAVRAANQAFYDAHEARDLAAMTHVWEHSPRVACIHPGWPILRGWDNVMQSWEGIFQGSGRNQFILTNESHVVIGDAAWVHLDENLVDTNGAGTIAATNMFARAPTGLWQLVAHHGSPVMNQ